MRNYILLLGYQWTVNYDSPTFGSGQFQQYIFGGTKPQLMSNVQKLNADTAAAFDADYTFTYEYPNDPKKVYILLDKASVLNTINGINAQIWYDQAQITDPAAQTVRNQIEKSPRQTWPTTLGTDGQRLRTKRGDFRGAQGLFDAYLALPELVTKLRKAGRAREAGIVQYAYDQVRQGRWTITHAFTFIDENVEF